MESEFFFTSCQVGAEAALKRELARLDSSFRPAFSRPGFVTFKSASGRLFAPDFGLPSVFARSYGLSLGPVRGGQITEVMDSARRLQAQIGRGGKLRLHLWEREFHVSGEEPLGFARGAIAARLRAEALKAPGFGELFLDEPDAKVGDWVFDWIALEEDQWALGYHRHTAEHSRFPGGDPGIKMPPEAPSRAYRKLEEMLRWSMAPVRAGDWAVEIGSAPGGASYALLQRGVNVVGIDPAKMDPRVESTGKASFSHLMKSVMEVGRPELPDSVQWLLLDMNANPDVALMALRRIVPLISDSLFGLLLTIKLNDWALADEVPSILANIRALGAVKVRAAQLPGNRQEFTVVALFGRASSRS